MIYFNKKTVQSIVLALALSLTTPTQAKKLPEQLVIATCIGVTCYLLKEPVSHLFHYLFINEPHSKIINDSQIFSQKITHEFNSLLTTPNSLETLKQFATTSANAEVSRLIDNAYRYGIPDNESKNELEKKLTYCKDHPFIICSQLIKERQAEVTSFITWLKNNQQRLDRSFASQKISEQKHHKYEPLYTAIISEL